MFLFFMYIIGCLWAFDYGHNKMKKYGKVSLTEFMLLILFSLLSWITLLGLKVGNNFKDRENE